LPHKNGLLCSLYSLDIGKMAKWEECFVKKKHVKIIEEWNTFIGPSLNMDKLIFNAKGKICFKAKQLLKK
jgi:hypothetical protein